MKNNMKKIIVAFLSLAILLTGSNVFAASIWNTASNDCSDINIANYTANTGFGSPCWTGTNITANPGDTLNVRVYYHNTSTVTATNTYIKITPPTGTGTNHSFTAQILSPQGNLYSSPVTVNIPSSQSITFGSTRWYPNQSQTQASFLNGQNGSEVISSGGLYIGSIAPGWATQGSVVVSFHVSNTQTPTACTINNFDASNYTVNPGQSSVLSWNTTGCTSVNINQGVGSVSLDGSQAVYPTSTKTYTMTASNSTSSIQDSLTINVSQPSQMTGSINANPSSCYISSGSSTCNSTLSWNTLNPVATSSVTYNSNNATQIIATGNSGSKTVSVPFGSRTYFLYNNGTELDSATVSSSCASNTSWNGSYCAPVISNSCTINHFTASPTSISSGNSSVLSWGTSNCSNVTISNLGYSVPLSGTQTVWPTHTTTYTLTATSPYGSLQTRTVTVAVNDIVSSCTINHFTASPTSISSGNSSVLSWSTSNCSTVNIDGVIVGTSGSRTVWPTSTKTYTLNAQNSNGVGVGAQATVYVDNNDNTCEITNFDATDTSIDEGDNTTLKWNTNNCERIKISNVGDYLAEDGSRSVSPDEDTTYVLTAYDSNGSHQTASVRIYVDEEESNDNDCSIDSYTASDTYISRGDDVTLRWRTTDCDDVSISSIGDVSNDGSETVSPRSSTTYILRARGDNGSDSESIKINVDYDDSDYVFYNTNVITTVATNISQTGAQVNGLITGSNNGNNITYFEYGTTAYLGMRTPSRQIGGNTNFNEFLTNLSPNTFYYFRAVGDGSAGIARGSIEVFKTTGYVENYNTTTKIVKEKEYIIQGTTVSGTDSPVVLRIENKYQTIGVGDVIDYVVFYKNISSTTLSRPMIQVFIPKGITITNASRGTYSDNNRTLSAPIEDLTPGAEGVIYLQARVDSLEANLAQVVTTAVLVYTTPNGAQENAMAYALNNPKVDSLLGASAFFGGMFGMSLIGWLLLIILIMLLILAARTFYSKRNTTTINHF